MRLASLGLRCALPRVSRSHNYARFGQEKAIHAEHSSPHTVIFSEKGKMMRTIKRDDGSLDGARVALLLGLSIGLGIAVHEVFFLVGGAIAAGALTVATAHALQEHAKHGQPAHQHH